MEQLPNAGPVRKVAEGYYIVNINDDLQPEILNFYLESVFGQFQIDVDFEYSIYNCETNEMVFGTLVDSKSGKRSSPSSYFPMSNEFAYYFAVRFPTIKSHWYSDLKLWFVFTGILVVVLVFYVYSIFLILQQKKLAELQKDFINNMTHEFKTPISSILLAGNYLSGQDEIQSNTKYFKYINTIIDQTRRLDGHVVKVLSLAKAEKAAPRLEWALFDGKEVIENLIAHLKDTNRDVCFNFFSKKKLTIHGDQVHFENLIHNLLDNAIKYGGRPLGVNISLTHRESHTTIDIYDNGLGIPEKFRKRIFNKFFRLPAKGQFQVKGFGLGLFYVKRICDQHQWKIRLMKSEHGTHFQIKIKKKK